MKSFERTVKYYDLNIEAHVEIEKEQKKLRSPHSLEKILMEIKKHEAYKDISIKSYSKYLTIKDMEIDTIEKKASFLFDLIDKEEADTVVRNIETKKSKIKAVKSDLDGNAYSAHLCINLSKKQDGYLFVIEKAPNISIRRVQILLNRVINNLNKKKSPVTIYKHKETTKKETKNLTIKYKFNINGHPSDELENLLKSGKIKSLELVSNITEKKYWDDYNKTIEKFEIIKLGIQQSLGDKPLEVIKSICAKAKKEKKDRLKIRHEDITGNSSTLDIDTEDFDLLNQDKLVKSEVLKNFPDRLAASFDKINPHIKERMYVLI